MSKVNNGDMPAMPCDDIVLRDNDGHLHGCPVTGSGVTKREQFAAMAMQGFLSNSVMGDCDLHENPADWIKDITESSIEFADALLAQLEKGNI